MIEVNLSIELAKKKAKLTDLAEYVGITMANASLLKTGKVKGIRFDTLNKICEFLECQPGDILFYHDEKDNK